MAVNNASLKVYHISKDETRWSLEATGNINSHDEILWPYSKDYVYPSEFNT